MPRSYSFIIPGLIFFISLALIPISGCSTTPENNSAPPEKLLLQGKKFLENEDEEEAKATFQKILEEYPDSRERTPALVLLARAHYQDGEYEESKFHYSKFIELYPAHKNVDHAHFYKAMSSFKLMDISARDQSQTREALEEFQYLIKNFPKTPYRPKAEEKIKKCQHELAKNFFEIAQFYYRTGSYQSAILRLKKFMEQYQEQVFTEEAIFLLGESYYHEQNYKEAESFYKKLLQQYPRTHFAKEVHLRLKTFR